jgi:preprotein translocase subunit SecG
LLTVFSLANPSVFKLVIKEIATMTVTNIVQAIWALSAVGLIVLVLLHSPKGDGIGAIGGQAQLFSSTKSAENTLNRVTWALTVVFLGLTVVLSAGWLPK